ncbi:MAG: hypothetical protein V3U34_00445 [candidate division NC10 bacterium]
MGFLDFILDPLKNVIEEIPVAGDILRPLLGQTDEEQAKVKAFEDAKKQYEALLPILQQGRTGQMENFAQMFGPINEYLQMMGSSPIPLPTQGPWGAPLGAQNLQTGIPPAPPGQGAPPGQAPPPQGVPGAGSFEALLRPQAPPGALPPVPPMPAASTPPLGMGR